MTSLIWVSCSFQATCSYPYLGEIEVLQIIKELPISSLLDFGCSSGYFLEKLDIQPKYGFDNDAVAFGSTAVKCGRRQMPRITVEIEGTSKNVKLLLYAQNPVLTWDFSDTPHNAV